MVTVALTQGECTKVSCMGQVGGELALAAKVEITKRKTGQRTLKLATGQTGHQKVPPPSPSSPWSVCET